MCSKCQTGDCTNIIKVNFHLFVGEFWHHFSDSTMRYTRPFVSLLKMFWGYHFPCRFLSENTNDRQICPTWFVSRSVSQATKDFVTIRYNHPCFSYIYNVTIFVIVLIYRTYRLNIVSIASLKVINIIIWIIEHHFDARCHACLISKLCKCN